MSKDQKITISDLTHVDNIVLPEDVEEDGVEVGDDLTKSVIQIALKDVPTTILADVIVPQDTNLDDFKDIVTERLPDLLVKYSDNSAQTNNVGDGDDTMDSLRATIANLESELENVSKTPIPGYTWVLRET